jgi:L-seryl-tRNA(Ser) seleniumtransferase
MKRRQVFKNLSILPVTGVALGSSLTLGSALTSCSSSPSKPQRDIFKELGIRTFINAAGTYTALSASTMYDEVLDTIQFASQHYAAINEVQDAVGKKIAELCHAEAAMVTAGCWSALVLGTAGVITGDDRRKVAMLPNNLSELKSEVLVQRTHNHGYSHALTNTGAKLIEVETVADVRKAINPKTAMMWFLNYAEPNGQINAKEWVDLGKEYGIPTMIDMAADATPVENLWKFNDMGFSLVCVSGGKGLRGPQSAGILMGKQDLIAAARLNAPPNSGNIGRGMKVNKEEIIGMYVALEKFINSDHKVMWKMWEDRIAVIVDAVKAVDGVTTNVTVPEIANITPTLSISWDQEKIKVNGNEMRTRLREGTPSIEMMGGRDNVIITAWMMHDGDAEIVALRMVEELKKATA